MRALAAVLARRALAVPGVAAGAASVKRDVARANRSGQGLYAQKIASPLACLFLRSFGLPRARAAAHNFVWSISIPRIARRAGGSVRRGLAAAGGHR
jgi:hypothetical protein